MPGLEWILGGAGAVILALLAAFMKGRAAGRDAERSRQRDAELKAHKTRETVDDEVRRSDPDAVRGRLRDWSGD